MLLQFYDFLCLNLKIAKKKSSVKNNSKNAVRYLKARVKCVT